MAQVPSTFQLAPGSTAPAFSLPDFAGNPVSPEPLVRQKRGLLVVFACRHCPFVVHLAAAVKPLPAGRETPPPWFPSTGCNIKWKPGNEPEWFG